MSDTPETDALLEAINGDEKRHEFDFVEMLDHARRLERERDEARKELENHIASTIHSCHDECQRPICVLRRERDEARRYANDIYLCQGGVAPCDLAVKLMAELNKARQQLATQGESTPQDNPTRHGGRVEKTEQDLQQ